MRYQAGYSHGVLCIKDGEGPWREVFCENCRNIIREAHTPFNAGVFSKEQERAGELIFWHGPDNDICPEQRAGRKPMPINEAVVVKWMEFN